MIFRPSAQVAKRLRPALSTANFSTTIPRFSDNKSVFTSPKPNSSTFSSTPLFASIAAAVASATAVSTFAFANFQQNQEKQNISLPRRWDSNEYEERAQVKRVMTKRPYLYKEVTKSTKERMKNNTVIVSGSSHPNLAQEIVQYLDVELSWCNTTVHWGTFVLICTYLYFYLYLFDYTVLTRL